MGLGILFVVGGFSLLILTAAAAVMLRVSDKDVVLQARMAAARGSWAPPAAPDAGAAGMALALGRGVAGLGRLVMQSGILPGKTRAELAQTLSAAGFRGPAALSLFVGSKLAMLFGLPLFGWVAAQQMQMAPMTMWAVVGMAGVAGLVLPDMVIGKMRKGYLQRLEVGVSDALDLLVICAQAGLSLEPAMQRVSVELQGVHKEMCLELATTVRELEIMADSPAALTAMAQRTGLDSLQRLSATLIQTMQYGTPLSESLRTLSNEMRTAALTRFEEKAARLPVLLTLPMIMFILPCVFMIVGGPAGIQIGRSMGGG